MNHNAIPQCFQLVHSGQAAKIGMRSQGKVQYQILTDTAREQIWVRLSGNDSSGCFSPEPIAFAAIESCVQSVQKDRPVSSKALMACFRGRSSNNGPFLTAVLRDLGLLKAQESNTNLSQLAGDWQAWTKAMLEAPGVDFEIPPKEKPVAGSTAVPSPEAATKSPEHRKPAKAPTKAGKRGKTVTEEDNDDAHCPENE